MSIFSRHKSSLVEPEQTLPGRTERTFPLADKHLVLDAPVVTDEVPDGYEVAVFGLGCFWGAEEIYWKTPGRLVDVGRVRRRHHPATRRTRRSAAAAPTTPRPCGSSSTPKVVSYADLVKTFFEVHDPTQGMRQGNDVGTQYRSAIYWTTPEQEKVARELTDVYGDELERRRLGAITTEIRPASETPYYYAEDAPPAVPREEPVRLPLPREHRREVPGLTSCRSPTVYCRS